MPKFLIDTTAEENIIVEAENKDHAKTLVFGEIVYCAEIQSCGTSNGTSNRAFDRQFYNPNPEPTYKQLHGRCEDAPCCGCCGGNEAW